MGDRSRQLPPAAALLRRTQRPHPLPHRLAALRRGLRRAAGEPLRRGHGQALRLGVREPALASSRPHSRPAPRERRHIPSQSEAPRDGCRYQHHHGADPRTAHPTWCPTAQSNICHSTITTGFLKVEKMKCFSLLLLLFSFSFVCFFFFFFCFFFFFFCGLWGGGGGGGGGGGEREREGGGVCRI